MDEDVPRKRGPYARSAERRRAIVDAALEVFAAKGYLAGSLQDIADRIGVSQTSLLHYFPRKRDLLLAVLDQRDAVDKPPAGLSFPDDVLAQADLNARHHGLPELYTVLCGESVTEGHPAREHFARRFASLRDQYADELRGLAEEGRLRPGIEPSIAATGLIAIRDGLQTQWLLDPDVDVTAGLRAYLALILVDAPESEASVTPR
ncbi:TetR family transcriptional regulator [Microbacterium barkeri]|uniref:TetR family transcriptional regulator n=1 Tax=Microbacterium barkeri TaxID=33917 RepID=A0A9W6LX65_9MICO|nr:TetR/AcrR family transcriptional regulator [Microbacterium barkeri]MDR6875397.1 AcrR family transcriptional regulator [Microbacterium barkeri]GLJ62529.1 TetR family transcriptional regulator [Microbacterium barkeri]